MSDRGDLIHELGMLARIQRGGLAFLGSGRQSVAEHSYRVACIALMLARACQEPVDEARLTRLCLFHDFPEARTGDQNYVNRKYVRADLDHALSDLEKQYSMGCEIASAVREFERGETLEARLARDADQIDFLALLREEADRGNPRALDWMDPCRRRVRTEAGKALAEEVLSTPSDHWWFHNKQDPHWVHGQGG